jgi:hypothetical protein
MKKPEKKKGATETEVTIEVLRSGEKLIVPTEGSLNDCIRALQRKQDEEEKTVDITFDFDMTPPEGALALMRTLKDLYGFVDLRGFFGFFGNELTPDYINVETAPGVFEEVPWGRLMTPNTEDGWLSTGINWQNAQPKFQLTANVKGKYRPEVQKIIARVKELAKEQNLYKGHAIAPVFPEMTPKPNLADFLPQFINFGDITEDQLIFSEEIQRLVRDTIYTPIEHTKDCREYGISLKRGVLLEGPYGTGKTLTAAVVSKKCKENGWTFLYLKDITKLREAIEFARRYQPAVLFSEDIDQVLQTPDGREAKVNDILNSIDGVEAKKSELMVILTTNNVHNITTAMLRPGRLDAVIPVRAPDEKTVQKLVRHFSGNLLAPNQDLAQVGELLKGQIPATILEVINRAKLGAVWSKGPDGLLQITSGDLETAARGMLAHMELLKPIVKDKRSNEEKAAEIIATKLGEAIATHGMPKANGKTTSGESSRAGATA